MALTYLQLINRILPRISQNSAVGIPSSGHGLIVSNLINETQNELFNEANWYTLFKTRLFNTATYTAATIAFNVAAPDTITDTGNAFITQNFQSGMQVMVSGSTSNDGVYLVDTVAAGTLTLQSSDSLIAEALGASVSIYAVTYPVATDFGRNIDLLDITNNRILDEDYTKTFDYQDPNADYTGTPLCFGLEARNYRIFPVADSDIKIRERYWKIPTALSATGDTSDLPIECENLLINISHMRMLEYLQKYESADRLRIQIYGKLPGDPTCMMERAKVANKKILDKRFKIGGSSYRDGIDAPKFPSHYPRYS